MLETLDQVEELSPLFGQTIPFLAIRWCHKPSQSAPIGWGMQRAELPSVNHAPHSTSGTFRKSVLETCVNL